MILEKIKSKLTVFFLYGSSFDIVRWDMTLKKKKKLSYHKICHVLSWFNAVRHHHFLPNFLDSPKPGKVARHLSTWMNSESYIFLCVCFFFSNFLIKFAWYFEKAEKSEMKTSEMLKKCRYNKRHKPFIYRQQLSARYNSLKWPEMLLGELKCSLFALLVLIQCSMSNWSATHMFPFLVRWEISWKLYFCSECAC